MYSYKTAILTPPQVAAMDRLPITKQEQIKDRFGQPLVLSKAYYLLRDATQNFTLPATEIIQRLDTALYELLQRKSFFSATKTATTEPVAGVSNPNILIVRPATVVPQKQEKKVSFADYPLSAKFMPRHQKDLVARYPDDDKRQILEGIEENLKKLRGYRSQDGMGDNAIVYAHYFYGQTDYFITETDFDEDAGYENLIGFAILNGDTQFAEFGAVSLDELVQSRRIELDFYWMPVTLGAAKAKAYPDVWGKSEKETGSNNAEEIGPDKEPQAVEVPESDFLEGVDTNTSDVPLSMPEPNDLNFIEFKLGVGTQKEIVKNQRVTVLVKKDNLTPKGEQLLALLGFTQRDGKYRLYAPEVFTENVAIVLKKRMVQYLYDKEGQTAESVNFAQKIAAAQSADELHDAAYWFFKNAELAQYRPEQPELKKVKTPYFSYMIDDSAVILNTEYNPDVVTEARKLNGKWDGYAKSWTFDIRDLERMKEALRNIFGTDGDDTPEMVQVKVFLDNMPGKAYTYNYGHAVFALGRQLAHRKYRDSRVLLGEGVTILQGGFPSRGGSVKSPRLDEMSGTVLLVRDVPRKVVESDELWCADCYEIVSEGVESSSKPAQTQDENNMPSKFKINDKVVSLKDGTQGEVVEVVPNGSDDVMNLYLVKTADAQSVYWSEKEMAGLNEIDPPQTGKFPDKLSELLRFLKPGMRLIIVDHSLAPNMVSQLRIVKQIRSKDIILTRPDGVDTHLEIPKASQYKADGDTFTFSLENDSVRITYKLAGENESVPAEMPADVVLPEPKPAISDKTVGVPIEQKIKRAKTTLALLKKALPRLEGSRLKTAKTEMQLLKKFLQKNK